MSRQVTSIDSSRSARRLAEMKQRGGSSKAALRDSLGTSSPTHLLPSRTSRRSRNAGSTLLDGEDNDDDEEDDADGGGQHPASARRTSSRAATVSNSRKAENPQTPLSKRRLERKRQERKASVRKETYQIDDSGSDLTDVPSDDGDNEEEVDDADTESDGEMAKRLEEAGDGESLLGSAASDREVGETDEEEERHIIEEIARREAKTSGKRASRYSSRGHDDATTEENEEDGGQDFRDDGSGSLSPETLRQLGLDGFDDDMFAAQDPFHSSSEPSFTDFFGSDSDDAGDDAMHDGLAVTLKPRVDDDELTTDDEEGDDDETDISDLDEGMLSAPFLNEALAAGLATQETATTPSGEIGSADIPLLVIEDLDGRLIYARAGDGEAVFGSDGEFEFVDESDEEDTDEDMDGLGYDWNRWNGHTLTDRSAYDSDEGDTTDELPDENMPFPRLLIGSVAPSGGRNARRARALAAKSRRLSPNGNKQSRERSVQRAPPLDGSAAVASTVDASSALTTPEEKFKELDFSISTEELARDPQGTLEAAGKSLGLTAEEVARLVAGIQAETTSVSEREVQEGAINGETAREPPALSTSSTKPPMGSFMPTSFKSVRRAVIDGSRQAPSPFLSRQGVQQKGLANRKRHPSLSTPSSKRLRRFSSNEVASLHDGTGEEMSEVQTTSREGSPVDGMELDDVLDASMLLRGSFSSSPPAGDEEDQAATPVMRASRTSPASVAVGSSSGAGLNLNAFARWHRIPMGAFRDGQGAATSSSVMSQQPLGSFLLTRASRAQQAHNNRKNQGGNQNHSPFRGRGEGDSIHLGTAPVAAPHDSHGRSAAFIVSPILWPVRHGGSRQGHGNGGDEATQPAWYPPSMEDKYAASTAVADDGSTRKLMTRREKRLRKARKAAAVAIKAAMQAAEGPTSTAPWGGSPAPPHKAGALTDSPATAMPRLSITDASPRASPLPNGKMPLPQTPTAGHVENSTLSQQHLSSTATPMPASPIDIPNSHPTVATNSSSHNLLSSSGSSTNGSLHQPPSSVFGVPLHSPLFGGILNPTNLGFRDDLEDRDDEGLLTI